MDLDDKFEFPDEIEEKQKAAAAANPPADDEEFEIEIVDDTPPKDRGRKPLEKEVEDPTDDEIESYSDKVKSRIKELTHARHDERRAKEATLREKQELERLTQQLLDENKRLKQHVNTGEEQFATQTKTLAEREFEQAKAQFKQASEAFDTDAMLAAQEAMLEAKWKLEEAKKFKPTPLQHEESDVQTRHVQPEHVQADEKTLRWQAKNQWFGASGFEDVTSYALGLHQKLVTSGVDPRTDEYFEQIDARVKSKFPEIFGGTNDGQRSNETSVKKPASVVAPASRSTGKRTVQLTPTQAALVKRFNLDPKKYAAEVLKLEKTND
jgi:hypothetical protein